MKRILFSLMALVLVVGLVGGGAFAYLSDTEASEGNTFTAGTLDLEVDGQNPLATAKFTVTNMKPGDTGSETYTLKNIGSICGQPSVEFSNIVNYENGRNEPEIAAGDTYGPLEGELGGFLYTLMKWRQGGTGAWHEIYMVPHGHTFINHLTGPYGLGENSCPTMLPVLCENDEVEIEIRLWWHSRSDDNKGQSDSVEFDVIFHLDQ